MKNIISESIRHTPFLLGQILDWAAEIYSQREAVVWSGGSLTFQQLQDEINSCEKQLKKLGAGSFQKWGICLGNSPEFLIYTFALLRIGCIVVPLRESHLNTRSQEFVNNLNLRAVIISGKKKPDFINSSCQYSTEKLNGEVEAICFVRNESSTTQKETIIDLDPALILFTSGSTGSPQGIIFQHHAVLSNIRANIAALDLFDTDKTLVVLPLTHAYALIHQCFSHLIVGATICLAPAPIIPSLLCRILDEWEITTLVLVPPLLKVLIEGIRQSGRKSAMLRLVTVGAARADAADLHEFSGLLPQTRLAVTYGLTEAGPRVSTYFVEANSFIPDCVGELLPNTEARLKILPSGEKEIVLRGRSIMRGYTSAEFAEGEDYLLNTGDTAFWQNGQLHLTGRLGRTINRGGILLNAERIEKILLQHPKVINAVVKVEEHAFWGEVPAAFVEAEKDSLTIAELQNFCAENMMKEELPVRFVLTTESDAKSSVGKEQQMMSLFQKEQN
jgi:acyl-CoA synthetase (AMP-forming)/AMP-acid ligase II